MKYRLKELREDRDIKQQVIADYLNMTRTNYSKIENELVAFTFDDAIKLANFYKITLEELINLESINVPIITKTEYSTLKAAAILILKLQERYK